MLPKRVILILLISLLPQLLAAADRVFYRYINSDGVRVMNHTLPTEYSQKGYEVVSLSGKVLKVVPAALSAEEIAKREADANSQEKLAAWDKRLRLRYSSVKDIESAKKRKLASIETNVNILNGNVEKLNSQLQHQQAQAAKAERSGRKVSDKLLTNIENLGLEIKTTEDQVLTRKEEYQQLSDKFDRDIERFKVISTKP